ncbi:Pre-mRNA splicing factor [Mycena indigotica]|uniref:Pre-mRNA splicing factor n=1 Tax=Mycena indigotica TaxID=2126181 RepID=A0A8H6SGU0_9AGAR|nr:Pre-mRNA splicing factor [Mycena indigotica]KAF7299226.1 Pre-mRNA splicing factor [Mycena indigotica]
MARTLRPRKSQPSYSVNLELDGEDGEAGPSKYEEADSGSDFAPEKDAGGDANPNEVNDDDDDDESDDQDMEVEDDFDPEDGVLDEDGKRSRKTKGKEKEKATAKSTVKSVSMPSVGGAAGIARTSKRQIFILPTPSVHHRHRAVPLYSHKGRVERLAKAPSLFGPQSTSPTYNFTHSLGITNRASKAWGFNVGTGPLWEMTEDRAWYKEALPAESDYETEETRRPVVYRDLQMQSGWKALSRQEATQYLPTDSITTEEGNLNPPPPVPCFFGPFENQNLFEIQMFQSLKNDQFFPESKSHIFNPGAPAWGLDWCPIHPDDREGRFYTQYLAVAPLPTASHAPEVGVKAARPVSACVQIWTLSPTNPAVLSEDDPGIMKCVMVLCIDSGPAFDLKWCPLPCHDPIASKQGQQPRKLGLLAGTFEDGSFSVFVVPEPLDVTPPGHDPALPVYIKLPEPLIRIELEETACLSFDWGNSEIVAIGTTHGIIAVFDLGPAIKASFQPTSEEADELLPSHYITVHQSAIRALCWARSPPSWPNGEPRTNADPTIICSGGYDGLECLTDIRDGHGSIMNRTRDVVHSMTFSQYGSGPITIDHENIIKVFSLSPSMLGRGHILMEPGGPIWSLSASDYHPSLAVGSADGVCSTTNTLRSTRRGSSVPFFVHKIYQLDYSRTTKQFRMLDQFLPLEASDRPTQTKAMRAEKAKKKDTRFVTPAGSGSWPREVGVQRVVWNSGGGLGGAGLLASSTASALCRVDFVWGRWLADRIPYNSVDEIRMTNDAGDDAMDVDSDESD